MKRLQTVLLCLALGLGGCMPAAPLPSPATSPPTALPTAAVPTAGSTPTPTITPVGITLVPSGTPLETSTPVPFGYVSTMVAAVNATRQVFDSGAGGLPGVNPLTGKMPEDQRNLERRPLAVKITNFPRNVRPQWGLNAADHVWEYYLEDELTRFVGVYYGKNAERVGPVRSARPFDENLLQMYKAILAFGYADKRLMDEWVEDPAIAPYMVIQKPDNCPPMCRIGAKDSYNNLFTNTAQLSEYIAARGTSNNRQPLEGLMFDPPGQAAAGGESAPRVEIRFSAESYLYWQYQPAAGRYLRWQDTERRPAGEESYTPLMDSLDNRQLAADNIVILMAYNEYVYVSSSTDVITHNLMGSGLGFALRDGRIFPITWQREQHNALVQLAHPNGRPFLLKPGNVWFEVLSDLTEYTSQAGNWRFVYDIPPVPTITPRRTATPVYEPLVNP